MKKTTKVWLIIAVFLVLIGCVLFAAVMSALKWDFTKLSTVQYETNTYEISKAFDSISVNTQTADIVLALSDNGKCKVECHEEENAKHFVTVEEGILNIELVYERNGYFGLDFGSPGITVYLPETQYNSLFIDGSTGDIEIPKVFCFNNADISLSTGDVEFDASVLETIEIKTGTGDINAENFSAGAVELSVSTGRVTVSSLSCEGDITVGVTTGDADLNDIRCKSVISSGGTGDISLNNVIAAERFSIKRSTGDVRFESSDAAEIFIETGTGYVMDTLLTDKMFVIQTDTGDVDVPQSTNGGICKVTTGTGDIKLNIQ